MRANVNIDTEAYAFASAYASAKGIPLGRAISELLRRAAEAPELPVSASSKLKTDEYGVLVVKATGQPITPAMVKVALEEDFD